MGPTRSTTKTSTTTISTTTTSITTTSTTTTSTTTTTTSSPKNNIRRDKPRPQCPNRYCDTGDMMARCWPDGNCGSRGGGLSNKWFSIGTTFYSTDLGSRQSLFSYYHPQNSDMDCLPCCLYVSNVHSKMPSKNSMINSHILTGYLSMWCCSECWQLVWMVCEIWSLWRRFLS